MKKKIILGIIGFIILIGIIGAIGGGSQKPQKVGENATVQSNNQLPSAPQQDIYKVGDKVQLGKVILTVNKVETSEGGQYTKPSEGNHWVDLNLTIENTGSTQEYITTLGQMFIVDDQNNQYQVSVTGKRLENTGSFGLDGTIVAGAKRTDWVGFEVPKTAKGLKLHYNASFYSNKKILVDLGI